MPPQPIATRPHSSAILTARGVCRQIRKLQPSGESGLGEHTILAAIRAGDLAGFRDGRWYRVRWAAVEEWLARRNATAPPAATRFGDANDWAAQRWRQPGEVIQKATDDFARRFVVREASAVLEAYRETLDASRRILALATAQIQSLEVRPTEATPAQLKELAEILRKIHSVRSDIGGLGRCDVWCGSGESSDSDQDLSDAEIVMAALKELESSESPD